MKCYYEELGVARDAIDSDIKTAYRKLALRWHPDKNLQNLEEAKERFQLIQQAYDVLSDSHERAWYDNHREQILRGKNSEYEENCLDVFQYFTVSCYKGYGDDSKGFYAVYREVFAKIVAEDAEFMDDEEKVAEIPSFGDSQSNYEEVVGPFYAFWQAYCTKKTYTWLCPYDIKEIKDRRILREIEKELKKLAQKAKKERNEEVRNLVSFIRKRDKRVQAYKVKLEERAALNRQKQEQNRLEQIRKRQRELEEMRQVPNQHLNDNYEMQLKELESHYNDDISDEDDEDDMLEASEEELETEIEYYNELYCVACNKSFKNERAYINHESSKKHRENTERVKQDMLEEEEAFNCASEEEAKTVNDDNIETHEEDEAILSSANEEEPKQSKKNKKSKKSKTNKSTLGTLPSSSDIEEDLNNLSIYTENKDNSDTENWNSSNKKSAKKQKNKKQAKASSDNKQNIEEIKTDLTTTLITETENVTEAATTHDCATCNAKFDSKNKLFAHLKKTNHSVYLPKAKTESPDVSSKKGKGKKK
ncbi:dnaJ homolog subfamily C member 21-like [Teleopsis dalmanni]|uniref:dnaJ homolog subfamily C member 21-like n=1 Tax=Teleopsis dalmanni TaxID=139649 RepID=UPI0018CF79E0|nr:dnaJ homolog subfamily C member 21-like [Teleopsis dalmanni]